MHTQRRFCQTPLLWQAPPPLENVVDVDFLVEVEEATPPVLSDTDGGVVLQLVEILEFKVLAEHGLGLLNEGEIVTHESEIVDVNYENCEGSPLLTHEYGDVTCIVASEAKCFEQSL